MTVRPGEGVPDGVERARRSRRHPRRTQFDYLHLRALLRDLTVALSAIPHDVHDALDVYCGTRPYDDLFPGGAQVVGLDVPGNPYGLADVVTDDFLPFPDASFDLVTCIEAFHYVADPEQGIAEVRRVLRPGGTLVISVPFAWEYNPRILEHRFTGPELADLVRGWDAVEVSENGGRAVVWATLTGSLLESMRMRLPSVARRPFGAIFVPVNWVAALADRLERRSRDSSVTLPMNLMLTARRPADD